MKWMLLILVGLTVSCVASDGGYWSFGVSRGVYGSGVHAPYHHGHSSVYIGGDGDAAWWIAGFLLLPVIVDVVLLPVTLTHDLFCVN